MRGISSCKFIKDAASQQYQQIKLMRASSIQMTAKKSHYSVDGTGRDSYINFDNGGNFRGYRLEGTGKFQVGTMNATSTTNRRKSYSGIQGKPLHYIGDGTGRDVYVISNEGGIADRGVQKKFNFLQSLRTPIARRETKNEDIFMKTNDSWRSKGSKDPGPFASYQRTHSRRLSEARKYPDPYDRIRHSFRSSVGFSEKR